MQSARATGYERPHQIHLHIDMRNAMGCNVRTEAVASRPHEVVFDIFTTDGLQTVDESILHALWLFCNSSKYLHLGGNLLDIGGGTICLQK